MIRYATLLIIIVIQLGCNRGPTPKPLDRQTSSQTPLQIHSSESQSEPFVRQSLHATLQKTNPQNGRASGLLWRAPEVFVSRPPSTSMRLAEYWVESEKENAAAILTISYFGKSPGNTVQKNLDRWVAQFHQVDHQTTPKKPIIERIQVGELQVTTLDFSGTYQESATMGSPAPEEVVKKNGYRILGAIAEGPQGNVFFKLLGPEKMVTTVEKAFFELIGSLKIDHVDAVPGQTP